MSLPGLGSFVGISEEATWNTPVARTRFFPLRDTGDGLDMTEEQIRSSDINDAAEDADKNKSGTRTVTGGIELELTFEGFLLLYRHAFGHDPAPSGAGPYTFDFEPPSIPEVIGKGLSVEVSRSASSAQSFLYSGCKVNSFSMAGGQNQILLGTFDFLGADVSLVAKSSPTEVQKRGSTTKVHLPNGQAVSTIVLDGDDRICRSFTFTYANKYEAHYDVHSKVTEEPFRSAKVMGELSLELEFEDLAQYNDYLNSTQVGLSLQIQDSANNQINITAAKAKLISGATPFVNSMGIVTYNPTFELWAVPGVSREFTFQVTTNEATIT
jgi:hypothetical protein